MSKRKFHISDILSVTHDRLFSTRHIEGVYDICNYLTGDQLFTHQLPRVHEECNVGLRLQITALNDIPHLSDEDVTRMKATGLKEWWMPWVQECADKCGGEWLEIEPLPKGVHEFKDPLTEAEELVGKDKVIAINPPDARRKGER